MYKVMVVDDEPWGRKSVGKMIGELGLGAEVIAEAKHGEEALALIKISKPHIVVTDMNMPVMDGQRFLETLHAQYNEIKVVVISGYSQFDYMKAALTYQACEYVLKPVSMNDLRDAMAKAIEAVRGYWDLQQERRFTQDMRKLQRETFLQHVTGRRIVNKSDIQKQADELRIVPSPAGYRLAVCGVRQFAGVSAKKFHGNADLLMFSLENMLRETMPDDTPIAFKSDDRTRICLMLPVPEYDDRKTIGWLSAFHDAVSRMLGADAIAGISAPFFALDGLPEAFGAACDELGSNPLRYEGLSLSVAGPAAERGNTVELLSSFDLKALKQAFASGNVRDGDRLLADFAEKAAASPKAAVRDVHRDAARLLELADSELPGLASASPVLFDAFAVAGIMDAEGLSEFVGRLKEAVAERVRFRGESESASPIREIAAYLDGHYFEDVSLIDVATRYHLDPSYLSKQFKAVTDENFIEYLTRKRMEKASELLLDSDRKINEVSELVGYENQRYFSQVFKKFTGRTPSEFREQKN